jgi:polysaccharide pyruvyl transferase WcaK-like protein
VKILHLYSSKNSGDGLLVDLTFKALEEVKVDLSDTELLAIDARSFDKYGNVAQLDIASTDISFLKRVFYALRASLHMVFRVPFDDQLQVAVGGGYMRNRTLKESVKFIFAHYYQLCRATYRPRKRISIYMPQSIGPFKFGLESTVMSRLKNVSTVFVRDDRSLELCNKYGVNAIRMPDLAVQELATVMKGLQRSNYSKVYLIARSVELGHQDEYEGRIKELIKKIPSIEPIVQSTGRGNNDLDFYKKIGFPDNLRTVKDALLHEPGVVISVRLHGAIESLIQGCPTIHLSYERKGFGAYSDLNIKEFVHNYRSFNVDLVHKQAQGLMNDSSDYWARIESSKKRILEKREYMLGVMKELL